MSGFNPRRRVRRTIASALGFIDALKDNPVVERIPWIPINYALRDQKEPWAKKTLSQGMTANLNHGLLVYNGSYQKCVVLRSNSLEKSFVDKPYLQRCR